MAKEARSLGWALDGGRSDDQGSPARPASYRAGSVRTALGAVSVCPWPKHGCVGPRLNQGDPLRLLSVLAPRAARAEILKTSPTLVGRDKSRQDRRRRHAEMTHPGASGGVARP